MTQQILDMMQVTGKVVAVLTNIYNGEKRTFEGFNIVTDAGDLFYAERGALLTVGATIGPVPTNFTDANGVPDMIMELFDNETSPNTAPGKGNDWADLSAGSIQQKVIDATYPQVGDGDADNTGSGTDIITYRVSFTTGEANNTPTEPTTDVILTNPAPSGTEPLIMHAEFTASFEKTSADTLKVFINHRMNGV